MPVQVGVNFCMIGVWLSPIDVVMSWLRLQTPVDCIPHPYHMYIKCFSTLICCWWAYGCTLTLLRLCRCWGWVFDNRGMAEPSDVIMPWLRLQTPVDCIPHPYHMYIKCFSTSICCGWAYGCTLTLLCLCRWVCFFYNWGMAEPEWCCNVMVEAPNPRRLHLTSISYVYKVF